MPRFLPAGEGACPLPGDAVPFSRTFPRIGKRLPLGAVFQEGERRRNVWSGISPRFQKIAWRKATHNSRFQPIRAVSSLGDAALDCVPPGPMRPYAVLPNGACRGPTQLDAVRTERARPVRAISAGQGQAKSSFPFRTRANEVSIGSAHGSTKGLAMTRGFPLPCCREKESGPGALERRPARFLRKEEGFCPLQKTEPFSLPKQKASVNAVPSIPCSPRNHNIYFRPPTTAASVARSCPLRVLP